MGSRDAYVIILGIVLSALLTGAFPFLRPVLHVLKARMSTPKPRRAGQWSWVPGPSAEVCSYQKGTWL